MPQDHDRPISLEEFEEQRRKYYGLPKGMTEGLKNQESRGHHYDTTGNVLTSPKKAEGLFQVKQDTADRYGLNASDPFENIEASFRYLSDLHKQVDKNVTDPGERWAQTLAGYHAGEGRLREVNKTGILPSTSDGNIRTDEYVDSIMKRWQRYDQGRTGEQPVSSPAPARAIPAVAKPMPAAPKPASPITGTGELIPPKSSRPLTPRERKLADDENARLKATPAIARMVNDFESLKREGSVDAARSLAAKIKQQYGKWMEVGEGDGWPYVKSKVPGWNPVQPLSAPITTPSLEQQQAEFDQLPFSTRITERTLDALTRGGGHMSTVARQVVGALMGVGGGLAGGDFTPVDFPSWRQGEQERFRTLEARRQARPASFTSDVGEGVVEAVPAASAMILGTAATGGGLPAAMAFGGGMGAAGADWSNPKRAAAQTAIGAVAPVVGGKAGSKVGEVVASRLASPVAQTVARVGGELLGGGAGNVIGTGAEELAFEGQLHPRELAKAGIIGAALNVPGAMSAGRTPLPPTFIETRPATPPRLSPQESRILAERRAIDSYTQRANEILRSNMSPAEKTASLAEARNAYQAERALAAQAAQTPETMPAPIAPIQPVAPAPAPAAPIQPVAPAPVPAAPIQPVAPTLPEGVRIIRQGDQIPPRQAGQRQLPMSVKNADGMIESVLVIAPNRIDGRRVSETTLRPLVEQAMRPQVQPATQPAVPAPEAVTAQPPPVQPITLARRQPPPAQFTKLPPSGLRTPRTPEGAIPAPPSSVAQEIAGRKLLPPATGEEIPPAQPSQSQAVQEVISRRDPRFYARPQSVPTGELPPPPRTQGIEVRPTQQAQPAAPQKPAPKPTKAQRTTQDRVQRAEAGLAIAKNNRVDAEMAHAAGDLLGAQKAYRAELEALQNAKSLLPRSEVGKRGQLVKQIIDVERNLANVNDALKKQPQKQKAQAQPEVQRLQAEEQKRIENETTEGLQVEAPVSRRTAKISPVIAEEPTNRITEGEGAELPREVGRPLEGQPTEIGRRIPPPSRPAGGRFPRRMEGKMYPEFPGDRRGMVSAGRNVSAEIKAGRGEQGPFGRIAEQMFKSTSGQVPHGHDAFFHDPHVKGALGLSRDAEMGEVRAELKKELARAMGVKADEVSLTQINPDVWRRWARQKGLPESARAKMQVAIERYQKGELNDTEKTAPAQAEQPSERVGAVSETAKPTEQPRTVTHPDERINGKEIVAKTQDGRVIVPNPENKSGVSVVKDRTGELAKEQGPVVEKSGELPGVRKPGAATPQPVAQTPETPAGREASGSPRTQRVTAEPAPEAVKPKAKIDYTIPEQAAPDLARPLRRPPKQVEAPKQETPAKSAGADELIASFKRNTPARGTPEHREIESRASLNRMDVSTLEGQLRKAEGARRRTRTGSDRNRELGAEIDAKKAQLAKLKVERDRSETTVSQMYAEDAFEQAKTPLDKMAALMRIAARRNDHILIDKINKALIEGIPERAAEIAKELGAPPDVLTKADVQQIASAADRHGYGGISIENDIRRAISQKAGEAKLGSAKKEALEQVQGLTELSESERGVVAGNISRATHTGALRHAVESAVRDNETAGEERRQAESIVKSAKIPPAAEVEASVGKQKQDKTTGLTPLQETYLIESLKANLPALNQAKSVRIKVPGDGSFTVADRQQANNLAYRVSGKPLQGGRATVKGFTPTSGSMPNLERTMPKTRGAYPTDVEGVVPIEDYRVGGAGTLSAPTTNRESGWAVAKLEDGRSVYTNGHMLVTGKPPANHPTNKSVPVEQINDILTKSKFKRADEPVAFFTKHDGETPYMFFKSGRVVNALYYDHVMKMHPNGEWAEYTFKDKSVMARTVNGEPAAMVMPYDMKGLELPEGVKPYLKKSKAEASMDVGVDIVQRMLKLKPSAATGAPVEISELRREFSEMSPEDFDRAMLALRDSGRINLLQHDYPQSLRESVRGKLIQSGDTYYTAATINPRPGTVMGFGPGALQGLFGRKSKTPAPEPQPGELTRRERVGRKIGTAQTMAQLLNPKTIIQNTVSNAAFSGAKNAATFVALPVDKFLSTFSKERQVATPELRTQVRDFMDGFADIYHAVRAKDYAALAENKYELANERVYKGKVGGFFEDVMNITLRAPDRGAFLAAYNDAVQQIQKAHAKGGKPFSLDAIHEQAKMEAQQAVFQDKNMISDLAVGLRKALNRVTPFGKRSNFGLGDLIGLKYARIPANLLARGIEYSPLNFVNAFYKIGKVMAGRGRGFDQRNASLAFGKAFVGSAFGSGLGAALYQMGVITQPEQENRGVAAAERGEGLTGYQLNLSALKRYAGGGLLDVAKGDFSAGKKQAGDVLMSYDWLQPWAFSIGMGAAAMKAYDKRKADADAIEDTLTQIDAVTSTLTDQSILRNIRDIDKYGLKSTGRKIATDTPASFVPGVLNQARQIIDDRAREISHEKGGAGMTREALDKVLNRLPRVSQRLPGSTALPERKDIVGRSVPSRLEGKGGAALVPFPGRFNQYNPHPVLSEMQNAGVGTTGVTRKPGEAEAQYRKRKARAAEWLNEYGRQLTTTPAFQSASKEEQAAALNYLKGQISKESGEKHPSLYLFSPGNVLQEAREAERKKRRKAQSELQQ